MKNKILILALVFIFTVLVSGCTGLNSGHSSGNPQEVSVSQTNTPVESLAGAVQPAVSWKDFYPEHDEQEKSVLIEKAKDEIMRVFPDVDRTTLNGNWVEHTRINKNGIEEIGRPYINFENVEFSTGDSRTFIIEVDPELVKIIYYSPDKGVYSSPIISSKEAKERAIEFIRNVQGKNSIIDDPDAVEIIIKESDEGGRPMVDVSYYKTNGGVKYICNKVYVEYDMSRDKVERYVDSLADSEMLNGMTTFSAEPDITFDEAIQVLNNNLAKENVNLDELEYSVVDPPENSYLWWWDEDSLVYADNPDPLRLVWYIGYSDEESRKSDLFRGVFRMDAHTGEILWLKEGSINIKKY